ncbi:helix-turn-helix transcriptional regulator [Rhizobium giardinii]|uniref:helix-turn-helix transcriptional regulator n=1 Tax=Rhizobium giardinii TaxID=56731 RepID=UPI0039E191D9
MEAKHPLTKWRTEKKLTQSDLAEKLNVTRWMVNRIETFDRNPSMSLAIKIGELTGGKVTLRDIAATRKAVSEKKAAAQ